MKRRFILRCKIKSLLSGGTTMGNRAVITTEKRELGVYVHWNGGYDCIEGFLKYCEIRGFRSPTSDPYGWARLVQVIANYMGGDGLSVGISPYTTDEYMNPGDNGIYIIRGWEIVDRIYPYENFEEEIDYDINEFMHEIDMAQPRDQRIGNLIDAEFIPISEIKVGDTVYVDMYGVAPRQAVVTREENGTKFYECRDFLGQLVEYELRGYAAYCYRKN
jgi:hypothetical protein